MNWLTSKMKQRVHTEGERAKDAVNEYGALWEVLGNWIGNYAMGVLGLVADTAVCFALIYGATHKFWPSVLFSIAYCSIIQWAFGTSIFKVVKGIALNKWEESAHRASLFMLAFFGVVAFGNSVFLSFYAPTLVEVASEDAKDEALTDVNSVTAYYDERVNAARERYESDVNAARERVAQLRRDVTASGEVRWNSQKALTKIESVEIPALADAYHKEVDAIEKERQTALNDAKTGNAATAALFGDRLKIGGGWVRWANILVNLMRLALIAGLALFVSVNIKERDRKNPAPPPHLAPVHNKELPPRELRSQNLSHSPFMNAHPGVNNVNPEPVNEKPVVKEKATPEKVVEWDVQSVGVRPTPKRVQNLTPEQAEELRKLDALLRQYKSKGKTGKGTKETIEAGIARTQAKIDALLAEAGKQV